MSVILRNQSLKKKGGKSAKISSFQAKDDPFDKIKEAHKSAPVKPLNKRSKDSSPPSIIMNPNKWFKHNKMDQISKEELIQALCDCPEVKDLYDTHEIQEMIDDKWHTFDDDYTGTIYKDDFLENNGFFHTLSSIMQRKRDMNNTNKSLGGAVHSSDRSKLNMMKKISFRNTKAQSENNPAEDRPRSLSIMNKLSFRKKENSGNNPSENRPSMSVSKRLSMRNITGRKNVEKEASSPHQPRVSSMRCMKKIMIPEGSVPGQVIKFRDSSNQEVTCKIPEKKDWGSFGNVNFFVAMI